MGKHHRKRVSSHANNSLFKQKPNGNVILDKRANLIKHQDPSSESEIKVLTQQFNAAFSFDAKKAEIPSKPNFHSYIIKPADVYLCEMIGQGSYSKVYQGVFQNQMVAIKKTSFDPLTDSTFATAIQQFNHEANMMEKFMIWEAPCIVPYYGRINAPFYSLVMKYMPSTLERALNLYQDLPWEIRYPAIFNVLRFASFAHEHHVLYRDFKAANVLLDYNQQAYVCDLGFAIEVPNISFYRENSIMGTAGRLAPEILNEYPVYSDKSDVYALGYFLWEVANNGIEPFNQFNEKKIRNMTLENIRENIPANCPKVIDGLIKNSWFPEPEKRLSAENMLQILEKSPEYQNRK